MKKMLMCVCAAWCAAMGWAEVPSSGEGWYTPPEGFEPQPQTATWTQGGKVYTCTINSDGTVSWGPNVPGDNSTRIALENALASIQEVSVVEDAIKTAPNPLDAWRDGELVRLYCGEDMRTVVLPTDAAEPLAVNNRRYCPTAKRMGGGDGDALGNACTAFAVATYAEFDMARRGVPVTPVDAETLHGFAVARDPKGRTVYDGAKTLDVLAAYLDDMGGRADGIEAACYTVGGSVGGRYADADKVRQLTEALVWRFGGFVASVTATVEWLMLDERLREPREYFGLPADRVTGVKVEINCANGRMLTGGGHAVLAYGYDDEGVWVENVWGTHWGDNGHAKIAWDEWARSFRYGSVIADADALRDNGIPGSVTIHTGRNCGLRSKGRVQTHEVPGLPTVTIIR